MTHKIHFHQSGQALTCIHLHIERDTGIRYIRGANITSKEITDSLFGETVDLSQVEIGKSFFPKRSTKTGEDCEVVAIEVMGPGKRKHEFPSKDGWIRGKLKIVKDFRCRPSAALCFATGVTNKDEALYFFEIGQFKHFKTVVHIVFRRRPEEALMAVEP